MNPFASRIMSHKYAHLKLDGKKETWPEIAHRVAKNVMKSVNASKSLIKDIEKIILDRKFMPGGRYLYAAGRPYHQTQNCLLLRAEDSREGWAELMQKGTQALMTGAGVGVDYSRIRGKGKLIRKTGGHATGPLSVAQMLNEVGRGVMQGGSRRSALWAGLSWKHSDIHEFIGFKNWIPEVRTLKQKHFNFPATMDGTNISVQLDDEFFKAYEDDNHSLHDMAHGVYWATLRQMLKTGEPGFSIDTGENKNETLRNAPVSANTRVLTLEGYKSVGAIVGIPTRLWTGKQWSPPVEFKCTKINTTVVEVELSNGRSIVCDPQHPFIKKIYLGTGARKWAEEQRVAAASLQEGDKLCSELPYTFTDTPYRESEIRVVAVKPLEHKEDVYCVDVEVEEHAFMAEGVLVSNCTEITSADDSDICNLGSINLARIQNLDDFSKVVELGTAFLVAGTVYSHVPYALVDQVRTKNRRLGLGLMGIHEWLLKNDKKYGPDTDLQAYMEVYQKSDISAKWYADLWDLSTPVKTRAIAPTGTISILGETSSGMEPLFCAAYKRRYLKGSTWNYEYVIDPIAKQLVDSGMDPETIEDAYSIDPERRVEFQAWLQQYVDHAISSTINLKAWGSESNNDNTVQDFGNMLIKYLPKLRGITAYPDGSRGGQPLTPVKWVTAMKHAGEVFEEQGDVCDLRGGSCGS